MTSGDTICIHQPNFLPWIGLIHKIYISDAFVVLDDVAFSRNQYQSRNTIMTANGPLQLRIPVKTSQQQNEKHINKIEISYQINWKKKLLDSIYYSYKKAAHFKDYFERLEIIFHNDYNKLLDLNMDILLSIFEYFGIQTKIYYSSRLQARPGKTLRLVDICEKLSATSYVYGGTADYMDKSLFFEKNINLIPQNFSHPTYTQMYTNHFVPYLSIVDWIFQHSKASILSYFDLEKEKFLNDNKKHFSLV